MSRRERASCGRLVPPSSGARCCVRGRSRARGARSRRRRRDPGAPASSPSRAGPARGLDPPPAALGGRGAQTHEVEPGQPSSLALGPAPGRAGPLQPRRRAPTVGAPSLLELLDLLQAQPRALVDAEVAQHLFHRLCVRVLHGCGGPAGLASSPRGLLASASHSGRGLVPPWAPRRGRASLPLLLLLLRPLPPRRALNHPAPPPPDNRPSRSPALAAARPGLSWAVGGSRPSLPSSEGRASFALNRPPGAQAAAPEPPPRSPEVIHGPTRAGGGGARPTPEGGTERGQRADRVVRGALALFPQLRTPDSGGGNCGGGEGGGVGDGSAAAALIAFIRRCLPSRRRRSMWTPLIGREGPARRGRHGPAPSPRLPPSRATRAHAAAQAPPLLRTAPRNPDRGRRTPCRARAVSAWPAGRRRASL